MITCCMQMDSNKPSMGTIDLSWSGAYPPLPRLCHAAEECRFLGIGWQGQIQKQVWAPLQGLAPVTQVISVILGWQSHARTDHSCQILDIAARHGLLDTWFCCSA